MTADTDGGTNPSRVTENFTLLPNFVVNFPECGSGLNPGRFFGDVDGDGPEIGHIENDEIDIGNIGDTLVIVTPTSNFELNADFLRANHSRLDMGFCQWSDDYQWFGSRGGVETGVSNVSSENRSVRGIFASEDYGRDSIRGVGVGLEAVEKCGVDGILLCRRRSRESEEKEKKKQRKKARHDWGESCGFS